MTDNSTGGLGQVGDGFQISPDDIDQQRSETCAFLSSLSSVAAVNPAFLGSHITQDDSNPYGQWDVQLYIGGQWHDYQIVIGSITTDDPSPQPIQGQTSGPITQNLWVVAYQRAYLEAMNVTNPEDNSTSYLPWKDPAVALFALTGNQAGTFQWTPGNAPPVNFTFGTLQYILNDKTLQDAVTAECPISSENVQVEATHTLVGPHEYSVVSLVPNSADDGGTVVLRNPWGYNPDGNNATSYNDCGYLYITWTQFIQTFCAVYWTTTTPYGVH